MYDLDAIRALHETAMASRTSLVEPTVSVFTKVTKRQKAPVVTLVKVSNNAHLRARIYLSPENKVEKCLEYCYSGARLQVCCYRSS